MSFNLQPTLEGSTLFLRPLLPEDFAKLYAVASDPLIWEQLPQSDRYKLDVFSVYFQEALESKGALIAIDKSTNQVIGSSRYYELDEANGSVAIGFTFLARSHWGHTFNREMKRLMLDQALLSVDTVIFQIAESNLRSQKAMEKIGGTLVGRAERSFGNRKAHVYLTYHIKKGLLPEKISVRPATSQDFEQISGYFLNASPLFLKGMGVDKNKLPPKQKWIEAFLVDCDKPDSEKDRIYLIWIFEGRPVGHSSVNKIAFGKEAFIHLHLWTPELRRAGLGTEFFTLSVEYFTKRLNLQRILCEPFAGNPAPNKILPKLGFRFVKKYETIPGQTCFMQKVNQYELTLPHLKVKFGEPFSIWRTSRN